MSAKIQKSNVQDILELSMIQEGMLFHYLNESSNNLYNVQISLQIDGDLDVDLLKKAFENSQIVHEALRSVFNWDKVNKPLRIILKEGVLDFNYYDLLSKGLDEKADLTTEFLKKDQQERFDLADIPFRVSVIKTKDRSFILNITHHHILYDGWSTGILLKELFTNYGVLRKGQELKQVIRPSYKETYLSVKRLADSAKSKAFWKEYLNGYVGTSILARRDGDKIKTGAVGRIKHNLPLAELEQASSQYKITKSAIIYAAFGTLLQKYCNTSDVVFGIVVSNRDSSIQGIDEIMGNFINTIPLRIKDQEEKSIEELVKNVHANVIDNNQYKNTSYHEIKKWKGLKPSEELFDIVVAVENYPLDEKAINSNSEFAVSLKSVYENTGIPLAITVFFKDEIEIEFAFQKEHIDESFVQKFADHFFEAIASILKNFDAPINKISLLSKKERHQLLQEFNNTEAFFHKEKTIIESFREQALATPDSVALIFGDEEMSYQTLEEKSNQVAHYLLNQEIKPGSNIGILMNRGLEMIVSILGILKAKCTYVPLNTEYPIDRLQYILEDAQIKYVLCGDKQTHEKSFSNYNLLEVINAADAPADAPNLNYAVTDTAYVMYTSGTTGKPKGILVNQTNILKLVHDPHAIAVKATDRVLQWSNFAFDGSTYDIYSSLLNGGSLCMIPEAAVSNPSELGRLIEKHEITVFFVTTALFNAMVDYDVTLFKGIRKLLFGGEMVSVAHVKIALDYLGADRLVHVYGPTETTVYATYYPIDKYENEATIPIGFALSNTTTYVVDDVENLCGIGIVGELYIGGLGVSDGYLNKDSLTAEKFISNPFLDKHAEDTTLYRTGDLVKRLGDGSLEFVGRKDSQVKMRGYRIELGEIEWHIEQLNGVSEAIVLVKTINDNKRLIGYVLSDSTTNIERIKADLNVQLPDYMVPSIFVAMETFPLTPNGKVDRSALPEPEITAFSEQKYEAPETPAQQTIAEIWSALLGVQKISINDDFFELGGDSIMATRLATQIKKKLAVKVSIRSLFEKPILKDLANHIAEQEVAQSTAIPVVANKPEQIPLSYAQERLWFIDQLEGSVHYHIPVILASDNDIDAVLLEQSIQYLINRHQVLRTVFKEDKGLPFQTLLPEDSWSLDYSQDTLSLNSEEVNDHIQTYISQPFDLSKDHMIRGIVLKANGQRDKLIIVIHHIAFDGWSIPLFINELEAVCKNIASNRPVALPNLPIQYIDYCLWQKNKLTPDFIENQLTYWAGKLKGVEALNIPIDYKRPSRLSYQGRHHRFDIDKSISDQIKKRAHQEGVSLFMTLFSVFKVLLSRYSGQNDICVGIPIANREQSEVDGLIGFFVNTLAIRSAVQHDGLFSDFLQQVKTTVLEAHQYQQVPFEKVVDNVASQRETSRSPLFQVMFAVQKDINSNTVQIGNSKLTPINLDNGISKFELTLIVAESDKGMAVDIEYSTELFHSSTIEKMGEHFEGLLAAVANDTHQPIGLLPMVGEKEQKQLRLEFNDTKASYPADKTIIETFRTQVLAAPGATAVVFENQKLSYQELEERSNQVAHYLLSQDINPQDNIGILMNRGLEMIVSIFGILKAKCSYVPLNTEYPIDRLQYILEDARASFILCNDKLKHEATFNKYTLLEIKHAADYSSEAPAINYALKDTAYIMYTSGTTGKPKGILVNQTNILKLVHEKQAIGVQATDRVLQWSNFAFDGSTYDIYSSLLNGGSLYMIPESAASNPAELGQLIKEHDITIFFVTTALFNAIVDYDVSIFKGIRKLLFGGEMVSTAHVKIALDFLGTDRLVHVYGPTETTVYATYFPINKYENTATIPIGFALSNTTTYVVDNAGNLCGIGVVGELYIGGLGVSDGYLNKESLTAEKFIANPFTNENTSDKTLYRTGDLVRRLVDGSIEFVGRKDSQIKMRGYRIELGEIERQIEQLSGIREAIVMVKTINDSKRLVSYVLSEPSTDLNKSKAELATQLPDYMVPAVFVALDIFPLTPNGKVDRSALPEPVLSIEKEQEYEAPKTPTEESLADIWKSLLGVNQVSIHDNFFELGGDSISAIQFVSRAKGEDIHFKVKDVFSNQTIAELSKRVSVNDQALGEQGTLAGEFGLLPIQKQFFASNYKEQDHFNQSVLLSVSKKIKLESLEEAFNNLLERHDALRLQYEFVDGKYPVQKYGNRKLAIEGVEIKAKENFADQVTKICDQTQKRISIEAGNLIEVTFMETPESKLENRLFIAIHHLAVDGVSWRILIKDLIALLTGKRQITEGKTSSYRQWQKTLQEAATSEFFLSEYPHWKNTLKGLNSLPQDKMVSTENTYGTTKYFEVELSEKATNSLLKNTHHAYATEINDILLSALTLTICEWAERSDVVIGLEGHGREELRNDIDLNKTIGWFTSVFPLRLGRSTTDTLAEVIISVKENLRNVPNKGIGYGVLRYLNADFENDEILSSSFEQLVFNYLGNFDAVLNEEDLINVAKENRGTNIGATNNNPNDLAVNGMVSNGCLNLTWSYNPHAYDASTIEHLAQQYKNHLQKIIAHCSSITQKVKTPSDYNLTGICTYPVLKTFIEREHPYALENIYKLSPLQEGMLFHSLYDFDPSAYVVQFSCDFTNGIDVPKFQEAWNHIMATHSVLRTGFFHDVFERPVQCVYEVKDFPIKNIDFSNSEGIVLENRVAKFLKKDKQTAFDLTTPPLVRITLIQLPGKSMKMVIASHHILWDGWSFAVLMNELIQNYKALLSSEALPVYKSDNYSDFIQQLEQTSKLDAITHWSSYLKDLESSTLLPFIDATKDRNKEFANQSSKFILDKQVSDALQQFAQANHLTMNTIIQGAWAYLMSCYTNADAVVFGSTVSGRTSTITDVENRVGLYINTIPVGVSISKTDALVDWFKQIQEGHTASREYQHTALSDIQSLTGIKGELFDTLLVFENYPIDEVSNAGATLAIENIQAEERTNFALTLTIVAEEEISIDLSYNNTVLSEENVQTIIGHLETLFSSMTTAKVNTIDELQYLSKEERHKLVHTFNKTDIDYPKEETIVTLFKKQVMEFPERTALVFKEQKISYSALEEKSDQLANYLLAQGVTTETLVPICMNRSPEMILAILAVLKTGAAFVPLDPEMPQDRTDYILGDIESEILLTQSSLKAQTQSALNIKRIELDKNWEAFFTQKNLLKAMPQPNNLAYVIYTSGTTGKPKGVMIEHKALHNFVCSMSQDLKANADMKLLSVTTFSFDIAYLEFFLPLTAGGQLVLADDSRVKEPQELSAYIEAEKPTHMQATPSRWQMLLEAGWKNESGTMVLSGGEAISRQLKDQLVKLGQAQTWNLYGPTETTIWSSICALKENTPVYIGKPIANTQMHILGDRLELLPIGVYGDLYIAGDGLARGYFKKEALTAEKFISNPFDDQHKSRMYKTGDVARWLPDGTIEYSGRKDYQAKIRGFRVELGGIEAVLEELSNIKQAIVVVNKDDKNVQFLVAFVVAEETFDKQQTQQFLKSQLPEYMVPNLFMELEKMPLTPNGKVDRKALPPVSAHAKDYNTYVPATTATEKQLTKIWEQYLNIEKIGVKDDFFDLGGHSLLANKIVVAVQTEFSVSLRIKTLFDYPTINRLAEYIDTKETAVVPGIARLSDQVEHIPLSYGQERLWFIDKFGGSSHYHMPVVLSVDGILDLEVLTQAFQEMINRHLPLRTIFKEKDALPYQVALPENSWNIDPFINIDQLTETEVENLIQEIILKPFDLSKDHMIRLVCLMSNGQVVKLVMVQHHIASDGWSTPIFIDELKEVYHSILNKQAVDLPELSVEYPDYSIWQRQYLAGEVLDKELNYWVNKLTDVEPLELPLDYNRPAKMSNRGANLKFTLDKSVADKIINLSRQHDATLFMTLMSVVNILLSRHSGQMDICIGTPNANREQPEVENLIGYFINILAIRSAINNEDTFIDLLEQIKENTLEAHEYQQTPFEKIIDATVSQRDLSRNALFQVMFVMQNNTSISELKFGEANLTSIDFNFGISKFDMNFIVLPHENGLDVNIEYSTDLFKQETIERMAAHFKVLINDIIEQPYQQIGKLALLTKREKKQILRDFNDTQLPYSDHKTMVQIFEEQVERSPKRVALSTATTSYSFDWLNKSANILAQILRAKGVERETSVGVIMDRTQDLIVVLFAILKAGGKYIPIEPYLPDNRKKTILNSVETKVLVSNNTDYLKLLNVEEEATDPMNLLHVTTNAQSVFEIHSIDAVGVKKINTTNYSKSNLVSINTPEDLAYVIFTSGSTGTPKGVAVQHKPVINLIEWVNNTYNVNAEDKILMVSSVSFDLSVYDIFGGLAAGASLRIASSDELADPETLAKIIIEEDITFWDSAPAMLQQVIPFLENIPSSKTKKAKLRLSFSSGDWIPLSMPVQMKQIFNADYQFIGLGGATEAAIWSNFFEVESIPKEWKSIPYGKPIQNAKYLVLDDNMNLCAIGVAGNLFIGGQCLAMGYINDTELSAKKFIESPFYEGEMLYNTGDRARWFDDGNIEFLGRKDSQVKIRGYRVELGDIEAKLLQYEGIKQVLAHTISRSKYDKFICAYYIAEAELEEEDLKTFMREDLPDYMLPEHFVRLDKIPMTKNGKVNRKLLPIPEVASKVESIKAPQTAIEKELSKIWSELLSLEESKFGTTDNFFDLRGHSILAVKLISEIQSKLNASLKLREIFECPTIKEQAFLLSEKAKELVADIPAVGDREQYETSSAQKRMFFEYFQNPDGLAYNITGGYEIRGELDVAKIKASFETLIQRHQGLRTSFLLAEEDVMQVINEKVELDFSVLLTESYSNLSADFRKFIQPFDLSSNSLIRVGIAMYHEVKFLFVDIHHIICDGLSLGVLMNDFKEIYQGHVLPAPQLRYVDFAHWQNGLNGNLNQQQQYWREQLTAPITELQLPSSNDKAVVDITAAKLKMLELDGEQYDKLKTFIAAHNVTDFMFFLSIYYLLMAKVSDSTDVIIGTDAAGRSHPNLKNTVGTFVNILPLRMQVQSEKKYTEFLSSVKECVLAGYENQDFQFDQMMAMLKSEANFEKNSVVDVHFAFVNFYENNLDEVGLYPADINKENTTQYEFKLEAYEEEGKYFIRFIYSQAMYEDEVIDVLMGYYNSMLNFVLEKDTSVLKDIMHETLSEYAS